MFQPEIPDPHAPAIVTPSNPMHFKSLRGLEVALKVFIGLLIMVCMISALTEWSLHGQLAAFQSSAQPDQAKFQGSMFLHGIAEIAIALVQLGLGVVALVLLMVWVYRTKHNAIQLGAQGLEFTPGWAVGWFFVPIMCLFKPYQSMQETYRASQYPSDWRNQAGSGLIGWWWALWIIGMGLGRVSGALAGQAQDIGLLIRSTQFAIAGEICSGVAWVLTLMMVGEISSLQRQQRDRLATTPPQAPSAVQEQTESIDQPELAIPTLQSWRS